MRIELRHWQAFAVAAETLHFSAAAERLEISQPALSQLIRTLEQALGGALFDRQRRRPALTDTGKLLLPEARAILAQASRAERIGEAAGRESVRMLNTGYVGSAAFHPLFSALIKAMGASRPVISFTLDQLSVTDQVERLVDHRLDLGIARSPLPGLDPDLTARPLARETLVMALGKGHPQAACHEIDLRAFQHEAFIQFIAQRGGGLRMLILSACRAAGFEPRVAHTVPQIATMLSLVGAGLGVALVPATMARLGIEDVVYRPLRMKVVTDLFLLHRRTDTAPALRATLNMAKRLEQQPHKGDHLCG